MHILRRLAAHPAWHGAGHLSDEQGAVAALQQSLLRLRRVAQPGSLIVLLSDFSAFDAQAAVHVAQLSRHNDLMLINIHDPLERELPPAGRYRVGDGRRFLSLDSSDPRRRERFRRHFDRRYAELQHFCRSHGATLLSLSTANDPLTVLQRGLGARR
jgi:uncharacterized protein (DUF58 family)